MQAFNQLTRTEKYCCAIAVVVCLYYVSSFFIIVLANFWPGPLFDYWVDIPLIEKAFNSQLAFIDLTTAHNNAHRILIPRLLFILDYQYFSATNTLLISVSLLCKIFTLLIFNVVLAKQSLSQRLWLNALLCASIFNAGNIYNVVFNFDIQWDLVSVFACAAIFFYCYALQDNSHSRDRFLAYLFVILAFFSHAGALSLPLVFILISAINKKHRDTLYNLGLAIAIFSLHHLLPIADPSNPDAVSALLTLLLQMPAVALFVGKFISGSLGFYLGSSGYYVSVYVLVLLLVGGVFAIKSRPDSQDRCHDVFLYIALFLFLMIISIAAARSMFSPKIWAASRFQTTVLLFILCLHIHVWLLANQLLKKHSALLIQTLLALHALLIYGLLQYFTYNIPYKLGNAVFFSQAYMLTHERNHNNGPRLLLWIHEKDEIADSDAFFRGHALAWYADKQVRRADGHNDFVDAGQPLLSTDSLPGFRSTCTKQLDKLDYHWTVDGGIEFSAAVSHHLRRKTWYAIDDKGVVVGFAYLFVDENGWLKSRSLQGYSLSRTIAYFADIDNMQPRCLYAVTP